MLIRLHKFLAQAGIASRRQAETLILSGQISVNGQKIMQLGVQIDPEHDIIRYKGKRIREEYKRIFLFNKPLKVLTSMADDRGRTTVADYFTQIEERVYPVGRLDFMTEGLLLVTNDGQLANQLMHPRHKVKKYYRVTVAGRVAPSSITKLQRGVMLSDGKTLPAEVRLVHSDAEASCLELIIREGRNRQIRRMCEAIGHDVRHLIRTQIDFLTLGKLPVGQYRELNTAESRQLYTTNKSVAITKCNE